jgi:hypothetical protein
VPLQSYCFWADDERIGVDVFADPYALPSPPTAEQLLASYTSTVHDMFPILSNVFFDGQVHRHFAALEEGSEPCLCSKSQAILNLVFAIGANHTRSMDEGLGTRRKDHLTYYTRARALGLTIDVAIEHADIPHVQG